MRNIEYFLWRMVVDVKKLVEIDKEQKDMLWEIFRYEKMLDDNEEILLNDLNYYEERIRSISRAESPIEISLLTTYMKHIKNIRSLLINLQTNRNNKLRRQLEEFSVK